jgi:hypothetical protein
MDINVHKAREVFNIPDDFEVGIMISIESKTESIDAQRKKSLSEIAFLEELGNVGILSSDIK